MNPQEFFRSYARSALGIASLSVSLLVALFAYNQFGMAGAAVALVLSMGVSVAILSVFGGRAVVAERERSSIDANRRAAAAVRERALLLASVRLPDGAIAKERDYAAMASKRYADACIAAGTRDPRADDAVEECVNLLELYKRELDDASMEKRFDRPDDDPFPDAARRVAEALREKAGIIDAARMAVEGGLTGNDRMSIGEELK